LVVKLAQLADPYDETERAEARNALLGRGWEELHASVGNTRPWFLDTAVRARYSRGEATGLFGAFEAGLKVCRAAAEILERSPDLSAARKRIIQDGVRDRMCPVFQDLDACLEDIRKHYTLVEPGEGSPISSMKKQAHRNKPKNEFGIDGTDKKILITLAKFHGLNAQGWAKESEFSMSTIQRKTKKWQELGYITLAGSTYSITRKGKKVCQ
jgi:hypothetical protein